MGVFDQTMEGGSWSTLYWHIRLPIGIQVEEWAPIETCEVDNVVPPDDLWFSSDTNMNCAVIYDIYLDV